MLLHGNSAAQKCPHTGGMDPSCFVGYIAANERLGIPALRLEDGPSGVADHAKKVANHDATPPHAAATTAPHCHSLLSHHH
jgi:beta-glucosidase